MTNKTNLLWVRVEIKEGYETAIVAHALSQYRAQIKACKVFEGFEQPKGVTEMSQLARAVNLDALDVQKTRRKAPDTFLKVPLNESAYDYHLSLAGGLPMRVDLPKPEPEDRETESFAAAWDRYVRTVDGKERLPNPAPSQPEATPAPSREDAIAAFNCLWNDFLDSLDNERAYELRATERGYAAVILTKMKKFIFEPVDTLKEARRKEFLALKAEFEPDNKE